MTPSRGGFEDDRRLARAVQSSERAAVREFVDRMSCIGRMVRHIDGRLGARLQDHDMADLEQQTRLVVWSKRSEFRGEARLETWMYRIVRLELLNAIRRRRRQPDQLGEDVPLAAKDAPTAIGHDYDRVQAAIASLPAVQREVILLKHFEDLTFAEIGQRLGIPVETAKTRHYRGLKRLRLLLRRGPEEPRG